MSMLRPKRGHAPAFLPCTPGFFVMILALSGILLTSACGFKLRGDVEIPAELNPMFIQASGASPVRTSMVEQLRGSQVQLATTPKDARVIIRIERETRGTRVAALDRNGKALGFELHYRVAFDVVGPDRKELLPRQTLDLVRSYDNPDVEVLGKQLEADLIYEDMVREAAGRVLGRLRMVLL